MAVNNVSSAAIEKLLQIIIDVEKKTGADVSGKLDTSLKGAAGGLAELDESGKVPATQLPSYVDDVVEGYFYNAKFYEDSAHATEITGETSKIYMDLATNKIYRWSGTAFAVVSETLALGTTASTAFRGDQGKAAYDHSQTTGGNPHNVTKTDIGLGNVENKSAASILGEMTNEDVTDALGYTPVESPSAAGTSGQVLKLDASGNPVWSTDNDTKYNTGNTSTAGITKLYTSTGTATDGAMTQAAAKTEFDKKVNVADVTEVTADAIATMYAELKNA